MVQLELAVEMVQLELAGGMLELEVAVGMILYEFELLRDKPFDCALFPYRYDMFCVNHLFSYFEGST